MHEGVDRPKAIDCLKESFFSGNEYLGKLDQLTSRAKDSSFFISMTVEIKSIVIFSKLLIGSFTLRIPSCMILFLPLISLNVSLAVK